MTEFEMVKDCYKKIKKIENIDDIYLEIPYMSRSIDMVIVKKDDRIITIEFKLKNWKKALKQAIVHKYGATEAYICMPEPARGFQEEFIFSLKNKGIGLYQYRPEKENPLDLFVEAREEKNRWQPRVDLLRKMIKRVNSNNELLSFS
ncbi:MAG: hypothetical protein ACOC1K_03970 [Nanoarchaeota archaeon]